MASRIDWNDPEARKEYDRNYQKGRKEIRRKQKENRRRLLRAIIDAWKISHGCKDCGYDENPVALDFDHVTDNKLGNVSSLINRNSIEILINEILKCEVVCANCHRIRTQLRRGRK